MDCQVVKISMILPNFNGEKYLKKTIESFINQDYENKELIIVDGKSSDGSHEIIKEFLDSNENIFWIKQIDIGISNAFNIGFQFVTGDVIGYIGSDDILYKNIFDEINYIYKWSNFDAVYFNSYTFYINENRCDYRKCPDVIMNVPNLLSFGTIVGWQNIFFKKNIYENYKVNENNKTCMDYELYLEICNNEKILFIKSDLIATINIFDGNISSDVHGLQAREMIEVAKSYARLTNYSGNIIGVKKINKSLRYKLKTFIIMIIPWKIK